MAPSDSRDRSPADEDVIEVDTWAAGSLLVAREDQVITPALIRDGVWEAAETDFLLGTLRPGDTFVDVGAHVGYFSVLAAHRVGPTGHVIAIEPEERNLDLLRRNLDRNSCANVHVLPFAAHARAGLMSLELDEQNRGGHRLVPQGEGGPEVRCVRLDEVLPERVDVVKIDAQGYDQEIVEGMQLTLAANPSLVLLAELSLTELDRRGVEPDSVLARYRELGFIISTFDRHGWLRRGAAEALLGERQAAAPADFSLVLGRSGSAAREQAWRPVLDARVRVSETSSGVLAYDQDSGGLHELNGTAALVLDLCNGDNTARGIAELVQEVYGLSDPPASEVAQCLQHLSSAGLIR